MCHHARPQLRPVRQHGIRLLPAMLTAVVSGCGDVQGPGFRAESITPAGRELSTLIVSNPTPSSETASAAELLGNLLVVGPVYISLPPGSVPQGRRAVVRNRGTKSQVTALLIDGGFDPVAVSATAGDTLDIRIDLSASDEPIEVVSIVPERQAPVVVRVDPAPGRRDVPLNAVLLVVFSEPIEPTSVSPTSIRLEQGGIPVAGTVRVVAGTNLAAEFTPADLLDPDTPYLFFVGSGIEDLQGERLELEVASNFTTGSAPPDSGDVPPSVVGLISITIVTTGVDLDPDGYFVGVQSYQPTQDDLFQATGWTAVPVPVGPNQTATVQAYALGENLVWLTDVDPNCSVTSDLVTVDVTSGVVATVQFVVSCEDRSIQAATNPLSGVWDIVGWEIYADEGHTVFLDDLAANPYFAGSLLVREAGGELRWQSREVYSYEGYNPLYTFFGGFGIAQGDSLRAGKDRAIEPYECDIGDCGGPLHGPDSHVPTKEANGYSFGWDGSDLVIAGPTDCYFTWLDATWMGCTSAWKRLTLRKLR